MNHTHEPPMHPSQSTMLDAADRTPDWRLRIAGQRMIDEALAELDELDWVDAPEGCHAILNVNCLVSARQGHLTFHQFQSTWFDLVELDDDDDDDEQPTLTVVESMSEHTNSQPPTGPQWESWLEVIYSRWNRMDPDDFRAMTQTWTNEQRTMWNHFMHEKWLQA